MNHTMQYKGYTALIEYSAEDVCFIGQTVMETALQKFVAQHA